MKISIQKIKELRNKTGCSLADCKNALFESGGDLAGAVKFLTKRGAEILAKKSKKPTRNGLISAYVHQGKIGVLVELACETDFVAKTADFKQLAHDLAMQIAAMKPADLKTLLKQPFIKDENQTIADIIHHQTAKLGENIQIKRFIRFELGEK